MRSVALSAFGSFGCGTAMLEASFQIICVDRNLLSLFAYRIQIFGKSMASSKKAYRVTEINRSALRKTYEKVFHLNLLLQ